MLVSYGCTHDVLFAALLEHPGQEFSRDALHDLLDAGLVALAADVTQDETLRHDAGRLASHVVSTLPYGSVPAALRDIGKRFGMTILLRLGLDGKDTVLFRGPEGGPVVALAIYRAGGGLHISRLMDPTGRLAKNPLPYDESHPLAVEWTVAGLLLGMKRTGASAAESLSSSSSSLIGGRSGPPGAPPKRGAADPTVVGGPSVAFDSSAATPAAAAAGVGSVGGIGAGSAGGGAARAPAPWVVHAGAPWLLNATFVNADVHVHAFRRSLLQDAVDRETNCVALVSVYGPAPAGGAPPPLVLQGSQLFKPDIDPLIDGEMTCTRSSEDAALAELFASPDAAAAAVPEGGALVIDVTLAMWLWVWEGLCPYMTALHNRHAFLVVFDRRRSDEEPYAAPKLAALLEEKLPLTLLTNEAEVVDETEREEGAQATLAILPKEGQKGGQVRIIGRGVVCGLFATAAATLVGLPKRAVAAAKGDVAKAARETDSVT